MAGEDEIREALERAEDAGPPEDRPVSALDYTCAYMLRNDIGNAERLLARYGDDIAFHPALGWLTWDGKRWDADLGELQAQMKGQLVARAMYVEARAFKKPEKAELADEAAEKGIVEDEAVKAYVTEGLKKHGAMVAGHLKHARSSGNHGKVTAMLAAAAPHRTRRPAEFDARPYLFNATNATLHLLPDGGHEKRPHARGDLMTKLGGCAFDPKATCPIFTAFLARIQPDPEMRAYLQRHAGYMLTGDISEQAMSVFHGGGRNGKGTMLNAWRAVLGEYAITAKIETFGENKSKTGAEASPDVARQRGARMIATTDAPKDFTLGEGTIKQATGEEPITARKLHKDDLEFAATGKIIIPCNPKPRIPGTDDGIWRRVHLVPFAVQIPVEEIDRHLGDKLRAEASGILNWMLDGYREWRRQGLNAPDVVKAATADYRRESDPLGEFLDVWTDSVAEGRASSKELFDKYGEYCKANGYGEPKSGPSFGKALKLRGFESMKSHGLKVWLGLKLRDEAKDDVRASQTDAEWTARWNAEQAAIAADELAASAAGASRPQGRAADAASRPRPAPHKGRGEGEGDDRPHGGDFDGGEPGAWPDDLGEGDDGGG